MGYVQLPDDLTSLVEQQVADGHAESEAAFVAEAVRLYAGYLQTDRIVAAMVNRADADMSAGRYVTVSAPDDAGSLHHRMMDRLRGNLASTANHD